MTIYQSKHVTYKLPCVIKTVVVTYKLVLQYVSKHFVMPSFKKLIVQHTFCLYFRPSLVYLKLLTLVAYFLLSPVDQTDPTPTYYKCNQYDALFPETADSSVCQTLLSKWLPASSSKKKKDLSQFRKLCVLFITQDDGPSSGIKLPITTSINLQNLLDFLLFQ